MQPKTTSLNEYIDSGNPAMSIPATATLLSLTESVVDVQLVFSGIGIAVCMTGATVNIAALLAVLSSRGRNHGKRPGLINLASACLLSLLTMAVLFVISITKAIYFKGLRDIEIVDLNRVACADSIVQYILFMSKDASLYVLAFLAVQQFVAVRWPLAYAKSTLKPSRYALLACAWTASAWFPFADASLVSSLTANHPEIQLWPTGGTTRFCYQLMLYRSWSNGNWTHSLGQVKNNTAIAASMVTVHCCVLTIITLSYIYVLCVIGRRFRSTDSAEAPQLVDVSNRKQSRHRAAGVLALVTATMVGCYMPMYIRIILWAQGNSEQNWVFIKVSQCLWAVAMVLSPLIYMPRIKSIRHSAAGIFPRLTEAYRCSLNACFRLKRF